MNWPYKLGTQRELKPITHSSLLSCIPWFITVTKYSSNSCATLQYDLFLKYYVIGDLKDQKTKFDFLKSQL